MGRWAQGLAATAVVAGLCASVPAGASASGCNGTSIIGEGSSAQAIAHLSPGGTVQGINGPIAGDQGWTKQFVAGYTKADGTHVSSFCRMSSAFLQTHQSLTYYPTGSGNGVNAWGAERPNGNGSYVPQFGFRSGTVPNPDPNPDPNKRYKNYNDRFIAYDDPPTISEQGNMNGGDPARGFNSGILHNIPVAQGAIANIVNFPDGCAWPASYDHKADPASQTTRFKVPNATIEKAWAGTVTTWGQMFKNAMTPSSCNSIPLKLVVRQDNSGTTYNFKQWLELVSHRTGGSGTDWGIDGAGWNSRGNNTNWPAPVVRATAGGSGSLAQTVADTEGSIGYVFLGDARAKGFDMTATTPGTQADTTFWIPVYNDATPTPKLLDPQSNGSYGYKAGQAVNTHGSNCAKATYHGIPHTGLAGYTGPVVGDDPTTSDEWAMSTGIGQTVAYEMCFMTWIGAWDDYSDVYGNSAAESSMERTVWDYARMITTGGQAFLPLDDYAKLPTALGSAYNDGTGPSVLTIAQNGVQNVHF